MVWVSTSGEEAHDTIMDTTDTVEMAGGKVMYFETCDASRTP